MNLNFGGKTSNQSAYIKQFVQGDTINLWKTYQDPILNQLLTPSKTNNVYIPGNLYVDGAINNPSDIQLKDNIEELELNETNKLINLKPCKFTFKNDITNHIHYGFIAQDFEIEYPNLISIKPDKNMTNIKAINYLEIIPLLVSKIQIMQMEIDQLKEKIGEI